MIDPGYVIRYNSWATSRLLDHVASLPPETLELTLKGTAGCVREQFAHIVRAEQGYLNRLGRQPASWLDVNDSSLVEIAAAHERNIASWEEFVQHPPEDLGGRRALPDGWIVGQALWTQSVHHGTDHRTQIGTILLHHDLELPWLDVWAYARAVGDGEYPSE